MNCKQYRACLIGMIVIALLCAVILCVRYREEFQIPADGTLVKQTQEQTEGYENRVMEVQRSNFEWA